MLTCPIGRTEHPIGKVLFDVRVALVQAAITMTGGAMTAHDPEALVLLRACSSIHEAYLFRSVLDAAGIDVFIPDEFTSPLHPAPVMAAGGVRIMVRAEDVDRAREILESGDAGAPDPEP